MAEGVSPHSGGTVPDSHRVPFPLASIAREPTIARVSKNICVHGNPPFRVVVLHGGLVAKRDDLHRAAAVHDPLASVVAEFHFVELDRRGSTPWQERQTRGRFYAILEEELR